MTPQHPAAPETEGRVCEIVRVRCPHREGLAYRNGDTLTLLPCDCNDPSEVVGVVGVGVDLWDDVRRQRNEWRRVAVSRRTTALADCVGAGGCVRDDGDACADTPCNANPAAPETETDANGLTEAEREALTRCDCGHDIGGEHNSYGCYGSGRPACGCGETDDRPGVNFAAVERIVTERLRVVEGERDAARREERMRAEDHARAWREVAALTARAESAEAAHAALVAGVEALAAGFDTAVGFRGAATSLRALLAGGGA